MGNYIDYEILNKHFDNKDNRTFKYEDVKHRLEKVAFDIVRFAPEYDDCIDGLWKIENTKDGDVILAMYSSDDEVVKVASKTNWEVIPDKELSEINVFYKDEPITTLKRSSLKIEASEVKSFCRHLINKIATDNNTKTLLLRDLNKKTRNYLLSKHPELLNDGK